MGKRNFNEFVFKRKNSGIVKCIDVSAEKKSGLNDTDGYVFKRIKSTYPKLMAGKKEQDVRIESDDLNDLIYRCIDFLKVNDGCGRKIQSLCKLEYFKDIDYEEELEKMELKREEVRKEKEKWRKIEEELRKQQFVNVFELVLENNLDMKDERIELEFKEKEERLMHAEECLEHHFHQIREKTETLIRKVFVSLEERNGDAMFFLQAMGRLEKFSDK
jgi:hypothetical protein